MSEHGMADKFVCQTFQGCHGTSSYINKLEIDFDIFPTV